MKYITIILLVLLQSGLFAQQQINRTAIPNSFSVPYDSSATLFPVSAFWAEMQKGFGSEAESMSSNIRFGGLFEFYRWEKTSLDFTLSFELTADPYNEISFNPRSARWQEELFLSTKESWGTWAIGLMHRCKHEVDNFDPEDSLKGEPTYRVLLSTGPYFSFQKEILLNSFTIDYLLRADYLPLSGDWRWAENEQSPDWDDLFAELSFAFRIEHKTSKFMNIYLKNWFNSMHFSTSTEFNIRSEFGAKFFQSKNKMEIYAAYESLYDDLIINIPRPSNVIYLGFRGSHDLFW